MPRRAVVRPPRVVTDARAENCAEALENDKRAGMVSFALHHLAAPPGLVAGGDLQSLRRRRERLGKRLRELELLQRGATVPAPALAGPMLDADDDEDLDEARENEREAAEEEILDQATAAATLAELKIEITTFGRLEALVTAVRHSGQDAKCRGRRSAPVTMRRVDRSARGGR